MRGGLIDFQNSRSLLVIGATVVGAWVLFPGMLRFESFNDSPSLTPGPSGR